MTQFQAIGMVMVFGPLVVMFGISTYQLWKIHPKLALSIFAGLAWFIIGIALVVIGR